MAAKYRPTLYASEMDYLFEYFCYAELVQAFVSLDFEINDQRGAFPVSFYIELINRKKDINVRIFHDQPVPKVKVDQDNHPLKDVWKLGSQKRPDFLLHFSRF